MWEHDGDRRRASTTALPTAAPTSNITLVQATPTWSSTDCLPHQPIEATACTVIAHVAVSEVSLSSPSCYVDTLIRENASGVLLRCPSGAAIEFNNATFLGTLGSNGDVDVCTGTKFPFTDGCTWQSTQRIRGPSSHMVFQYKETPIEGRGCAESSCTMRAIVQVVDH